MTTEIWKLSATELADLVRRRAISSREVVEAHLRRIESANPTLHAVTAVLADEALAAADAIDRAVQRGEDAGALCGVPITVKEAVDVQGSATTHGIVPLKAAFAERDAPHVAELRAAGAIPFARTNMPEFGMRWHTDNALHGPTRNPWCADDTPGGSSGGEAAALAAGLTPLGVGSDGAGSLRWPAQCCGIAALKPSHGRIAVAGSGPLPFAFQLLGVHGPMARRTADLRLAFQHMCSRPGGDPFHTAAPFDGKPVQRPIRVAVIADPDEKGVDAGIAKAVDRAARLLSHTGYVVEPGKLPALTRANEIYLQIMSRFGRTTPDVERTPVGVVSRDFDRFWGNFHVAWQAAEGRQTHDPMMERAALARQWSEMMEQTPLLLAPISTQPAWPVGTDLAPDFGAPWLTALRMVVVVNLLGLPSVAIPVSIGAGKPQVVQIIGPRFREDLCLEAAAAIEAELPLLEPIEPR